jgi:hypothetical protein
VIDVRLLIASDWSYGSADTSVGATNPPDLNALSPRTSASIGSGALSSAVRSPPPISTDAGQSPLHQASYGGSTSGYLIGQNSGYNTMPSNDFHFLPSADSGQLYPMNSELPQPTMNLIPTPMDLGGGNPSENYESTDDIISGFLGAGAASYGHSVDTR